MQERVLLVRGVHPFLQLRERLLERVLCTLVICTLQHYGARQTSRLQIKQQACNRLQAKARQGPLPLPFFYIWSGVPLCLLELEGTPLNTPKIRDILKKNALWCAHLGRRRLGRRSRCRLRLCRGRCGPGVVRRGCGSSGRLLRGLFRRSRRRRVQLQQRGGARGQRIDQRCAV